MASTTKAAGVLFQKKLLKEKGPEAEQAFLAKLAPDEVKAFQTALPITQLDVDMVAHFNEVTASVLFPGDPKGVWKIGHAMAKDNFTGMYKFLLSMTTVPFLVKQVPTIWNVYYSKGKPRAENPEGQKTAMLIVEDFPEMPQAIRDLTAGFVQGTLEFTNVKNIRIRLDESTPNAWRWIATWE